MKPFIVGIAGGTGSGKTTLAKKLDDYFSPRCLLISHDRYYRDQSDKSLKERREVNYDHPDALETDLLVKHLTRLIAGKSVLLPEYDFTKHTRKKAVQLKALPKPLIIIEGILIFHDERVRGLMDLKVFMDVSSDIRILRRTKRDIEERGRTFDFCIKQYTTYTRPMHEQFVEPSKEYAGILIPQGGENSAAFDILVSALKVHIEQ